MGLLKEPRTSKGGLSKGEASAFSKVTRRIVRGFKPRKRKQYHVGKAVKKELKPFWDEFKSGLA